MTLQLQMVLTALLTSLITGGLTYLASWGLLPGLDIATVSSGLASAIAIGIVGLVSSAVTAYLTKSNAVIAAAADQPAVQKIVADPDTAKAIPRDNVVAK